MGDNGVITWKTETRRLGDLVPWEGNPRQLRVDQAKRLEHSLTKFGYSQLVEIEPDGTFLDGHQRDELMKIMPEFGPEAQIEVKTSNRKFSLDERKEYIAQKHEGATGEWDVDKMHNLYDRDELIEFGFDIDKIEAWGFLAEDEIPEDPGAQIDRAEELREKWGVESGQLWRLGEHRLICGDCTDAEVVARVMDGEKAGSVVTDPPYNLDFDYGDQVDDKKSHEDYQALLSTFFELWKDFSDRQIITPGKQNVDLWQDWTDIGCWYKKNAMSGAKIANLGLWEPILFYGKFDRKRRASDFFEHNVGIQEGVGGHPCPKILSFWEDLLDHYTDDIVADPFLGSGTTLIACERLGRKCRAVEISPGYCAVAIQRWVDMTDAYPELIEENK